MSDKQPEALRLAELFEGKAKSLQTWVDDNEFVEFGYRPEGLKKEQSSFFDAAAELRRLHAVNQGLVDALTEILGWQTLAPQWVDDKAQAALAAAGGV